MTLSAIDVVQLNGLTAVEEDRHVDDVVLQQLHADGLVESGPHAWVLTLVGALRLRNLRSRVREEIERGLGDYTGDD